MNDKTCKVGLLNIRFPFMEAVSFLTDDNDGGNIAFVRLDSDEQVIQSLFQVLEGKLVKLIGLEKCKGDSYDVNSITADHIAVDDFTHDNYRLLHTCGERMAHLFQPDYFESQKGDGNGVADMVPAYMFYRRLLFGIIHELNTNHLGQHISIDLSNFFNRQE